MVRLSPEQVLANIKQSGVYDQMRQEMLDSFLSSSNGHYFDNMVNKLLSKMPNSESLEKQLSSSLDTTGVWQQLERDASNFWLTQQKHTTLEQALRNAISSGNTPANCSSSSGPLGIDPPTDRARVRKYYKRGDTVVAFVPLEDSLCERHPQYVCISTEVTACNAENNTYTVKDLDGGNGQQTMWVVSWDQLLSIRRPYEYKYNLDEQVYALYRQGAATDMAVSTEFFPGRVEHVGRISLAIRYDSGYLGHVFYDEAFPAGKVGFLRQKSIGRRRKLGDNEKTMVDAVSGRLIPSFTGFWSSQERLGLAKHGRKCRYREMPPLLVDPEQQPVSGADESVDMDIGDTGPMPSPKTNGEEGEYISEAPKPNAMHVTENYDDKQPRPLSRSRSPSISSRPLNTDYNRPSSRWDQRSPSHYSSSRSNSRPPSHYHRSRYHPRDHYRPQPRNRNYQGWRRSSRSRSPSYYAPRRHY